MIEINNTTKSRINEKLIKKVAEKFLLSRHLQKKNVSLAFVGGARMRELNKKYRKKDKTTDVLSFEDSSFEEFVSPKFRQGGSGCTTLSASGEAGESPDLGEIIINPAQIKKQALENNNSFQQELIFILIHGLLHLIGHDDKTEKDRLAMIKLGEEFIKKLKGKSKKI